MGLMVAAGVATAISAVTVLESVAAIGAVLSVVGTVTKNKTLSMIGMGMGVIGGVGALAAGALGGSAALFGGADAAAGDAAVVSEAGSAAASGGVEAGTWDIAGSAAAGEAATGAVGAAAGAAPDVLGSLGLPDATTAAADPMETITLANETTGVTPAADAASTTATDTVKAGADAAKAADAATQTAAPAAASTAPSAGTDSAAWDVGGASKAGADAVTADADPSMFGKLVSYAGNHPVVALGALQAGGSLLTGTFSSLTPAQVGAYNAQAAANDAAAAMAKQQTANLAAPKSVATSTPVTGTPAPLVPGQTGLINQAPPPAQITGKPA